jgi:hypothetical protein
VATNGHDLLISNSMRGSRTQKDSLDGIEWLYGAG